ncbi:DUF1499 domain-containing protein [Crocosphaera chwakensis]|uniref:DUF1499 domain-containing protein n=1 Tax=Crocosphaera chwakensis CCY0110 TaxID=391612 RepID=A3IP22_9CHRO|nr:DUF1499 domain-containing protein [Crocosphaera chwakensis]EAZ91824.1 hypothetical protein CY0110_07684 [Crocosphaera chwakensis CCY0110]
MFRYFLSLILVTIISLFTIDSIAYGTELIKNERIVENHLLPCPSEVACVASWPQENQSYIAPIVYHIDKNQAKEILSKVLTRVPRTHVIETKNNYILAESKGKFLGGIDELEFYFPPKLSIIELRSASRKGKLDLGVNRRRLEQIRLALKDLNI